MRATLVALCLLAGCRQVLGLEPSVLVDAGTADTADGADADESGCGTSDFDSDGVSDGCDLCPHVASTAGADVDSDGVGDLCDPNLSSTGDKRALWLTFESPTSIAGWTAVIGTWTVSNKILHVIPGSTMSTLDSPVVYPATIDFAIRMTIVQPGTSDVGFCAAGYCCTVANDPGSKAILEVFPVNGSVVASLTMGSSLVAGEQVDLEGFTTSSQQFKCRLKRGTTGAELMSPTTGSMAAPLQFYAEAPVDYRYVFVVTPEQ